MIESLGLEHWKEKELTCSRKGIMDNSKSLNQIFSKNIIAKLTEHVIDGITTVYNENSSDYIYFITENNIFNELSDDVFFRRETEELEVIVYDK